MSKFDCENNICSRLFRDYEGRYVFIKFRCPSYFGTAGRILDVKDNLLIIEYIYGGISVTCCDNISYVVPISPPPKVV
jgi:hypothetical protein